MDLFWAPANDPDYALLKKAATEGDEAEFRTLITKDIKFDALFEHEDSGEGKTALHMAAYNGHAGVIRLLLAHGVDVNVEDVDRFACVTAIYYAALAAQPEAIKALLEAGAHTDVIGPNDESVLSAVLLRPHQNVNAKIEAITLLLEHGMDINGRGEDFGPTILERAVENNDQQIIHFLSDSGASFEDVLLMAVKQDDPALYRILIDAGATDIDFSAVIRAAYLGKIESVKILLANQKSRESAGDCSDPVCAAARNGHLEVLRHLLDYGFAVNKPDQHGLTPLHQVTRGEEPQLEALSLLLDHGADPLGRTVKVPGTPFCDDMSVLQMAAEQCHIAMIQRIVDAEPETVKLRCRKGDCVGDSAFLTFARYVGRGLTPQDRSSTDEMMPARAHALQILLDAGADIHDQDRNGGTALHIIAADAYADSDNVKADAIRILMERGISTSTRNDRDHVAQELAMEEKIAKMLTTS